MFLARALWSQELEMKMKRDLWLNEENWVALAACVTLAVSVLIRLAAT
jgi:negative regulator of sigma E activity